MIFTGPFPDFRGAPTESDGVAVESDQASVESDQAWRSRMEWTGRKKPGTTAWLYWEISSWA